jgi:hypothetical protein
MIVFSPLTTCHSSITYRYLRLFYFGFLHAITALQAD